MLHEKTLGGKLLHRRQKAVAELVDSSGLALHKGLVIELAEQAHWIPILPV